MRIDVNGIGIEADVDGDGPAVLFVHGWPDSRLLWRHVAPRLADAGFRTVVPDLRGAGDTIGRRPWTTMPSPTWSAT
jgi:pimeloyl-ACP methyl ester carboxylesterase